MTYKAEKRNMNKLQLFTKYYITKVEIRVDHSRIRGTELPCKLREGLSLLMRRLSRMRNSSGEEQQEIIMRGLNPISSSAYIVKDFFLFVQELFSLNLDSNNVVKESLMSLLYLPIFL
jgi:hypothetical protein